MRCRAGQKAREVRDKFESGKLSLTQSEFDFFTVRTKVKSWTPSEASGANAPDWNTKAAKFQKVAVGGQMCRDGPARKSCCCRSGRETKLQKPPSGKMAGQNSGRNAREERCRIQLVSHCFRLLAPRWTAENRQFVDRSKPAISWRPRPVSSTSFPRRCANRSALWCASSEGRI